MPGIEDKNKLFPELEELGETQVREKLAQGVYGFGNSSKINLIKEWLNQQESLREADSSAKREAREIKTLEIAKEANEIARSASLRADEANLKASKAYKHDTILSIIAIIISAIAIYISIRQNPLK